MTPAAMFRLWVSAVGLTFLVAFGLFHLNPAPQFIVAVAAAVAVIEVVIAVRVVRKHPDTAEREGNV